MESLKDIKEKIRTCVRKLYEDDAILFERNNGKGLCERCLVFRLGIYLQEIFQNYFVDCDFNSAQVSGRAETGKPINNTDGTTTKRFVDIILHKRTFDQNNDFICFEIKKWNSRNSQASEKDQNNLKVLTREYGYHYGFHMILGKNMKNTEWTIFKNGIVFEEKTQVFEDQSEEQNTNVEA